MTVHKIDVRIGTKAVAVGQLIYDHTGAKESSVFTYHPSWLGNPRAFALAPDMQLREAPFSTARDGNASALPGPIADGTPDSWGRAIIRSSTGGRPGDIDYLLQSDDLLRSGALRYFDGPGAEGVALAAPKSASEISVPRLFDLDQIVAESRAFEADPIHYRENRAKMPGILKDALGSLGGARPKVNAQDEQGDIWIVKLAKMDDEYAVARAEVLALRLASMVGIKASTADVLRTSHRFPISVIRRFDRFRNPANARVSVRVPFISAQAFMGLRGTEPGNYVDLAQKMLANCVDPQTEVRQLFRRVMFGVLIQNNDDHLRNHGFLAAAGGKWILSPAYDINPVPSGGTMKTAISEIHGNKPDVGNLIDAAPYFETDQDAAHAMAVEMATAITGRWRRMGRELGMTSRDLHAISPALDSKQVKDALELGNTKVVGVWRP